jgi:protoporphyrinogen oxidase
VFLELLDPGLAEGLGAAYRDRLTSIEYFTALNLLCELDRPLSEHFWINVADRRCEFVGVIEHTNLVGRARTGGRQITHLSNYVADDDELLGLDSDQLLDRYEPGLRLLDPSFERSRVRGRWLFREPAAQPIVDVGYRDRIPAMRTPVPDLLLVNATQIYPEDRGTNYAARDGGRAAEAIIRMLGDAARPAGRARPGD